MKQEQEETKIETNKEWHVLIYDDADATYKEKIVELKKDYPNLFFISSSLSTEPIGLRLATPIEVALINNLQNIQEHNLDVKFVAEQLTKLEADEDVYDKFKLFDYVKPKLDCNPLQHIDNLNEWKSLGGFNTYIYAYIKQLESQITNK